MERRTVADALAELGWRLRAARDGMDALELAAREPPDGVLADLDMPYPERLTLCRMLADWPPTRAAPGVLASGALSAWEPTPPGADALLPQPFSLDDLEATIARILRRA